MGRLFAISDIHGCFNTFHELVMNVLKIEKTDRLILLGDYIDRGRGSREVIDFILDLQKTGFDVVPLTGNHEQMLLSVYNDPSEWPLWMMNSGMTTLISFGISDISEMEARYLHFFSSLEYFSETGDFIFVHAGFNDHARDPFSDRYSMIWESSPRYDNLFFFGKTVIHGHRPKPVEVTRQLIRERSKVIPIDNGCVYADIQGYGNLSALEVNSMQLITVPFSQQDL